MINVQAAFFDKNGSPISSAECSATTGEIANIDVEVIVTFSTTEAGKVIRCHVTMYGKDINLNVGDITVPSGGGTFSYIGSMIAYVNTYGVGNYTIWGVNLYDMTNGINLYDGLPGGGGNCTSMNISSAAAINILAPASGVSWQIQTTRYIYWTAYGAATGGNVKIDLLKSGNVLGVIIASTGNTGEYVWNIGGYLAVGNDYQVKITKIGTSYVGISNNFTITAPTVITLNQISIPSTKSVVKNNSEIIRATCKDTTGAGMTCPTLTWTKSNNNVDITPWSNNIDLTIFGVNTGTCIVTATGGGKTSNSCTVTVTESTGTLSQITITPNISIVKGDTGSVSYSCKDTLGNNMTCPALTWTSSNTSVATVVGGMITGVNTGICIVKAASGGKTSNDCNVTITSITPPPTNNYGCHNGQCLQGYGTLPPGCNNICVTPTNYNCVSGVCQGPYTEGTFDSYADCVASGCGSGGNGEEEPCARCDKETQYCLFGSCYKKNDVYMAVGAVVALLVLTKK